MAFKKIEVTRPRGINKDLSPYEMPNEIWSNGNNVDFQNSRVNVAKGYSRLFENATIPSIYHAEAYNDGSSDYWFFASVSTLQRTDGVNVVDVSRGYTFSDPNEPYYTFNYTPEYDGNGNREHGGWSSCVFNGALLFNNGADEPQFYNVNNSEFENLTAWPTTERCEVIRPFKNYLIALNMTVNTNDRRPTMVRWSDAAPLGGVPASWSDTNPASQAGYNILPDTQGEIIDGKALSDTFFIYKNDAVWAMQFIGGNFVFSFRKVFSDAGMLAKGCVAEFNNKHFVVGVDDIYIHDGTTKKSVSTSKIHDYFYNDINTGFINKVKCVSDTTSKEIIVYYPTSSSIGGVADRAIVWNWASDTWSIRDLKNTYQITQGIVSEDVDGRIWGVGQDKPYPAGTKTWESATDVWNTQTYNPSVNSLVYIVNDIDDSSNTGFYLGNSGVTFDGDGYTSFVEREGIDFGDDKGYKYIHAVYPHIVGEGTIKVYIGTEEQAGSGISWSAPQEFVLGEDYKVNFRESGRYIAIRFESVTNTPWSLTGYSVEYSLEGRQ